MYSYTQYWPGPSIVLLNILVSEGKAGQRSRRKKCPKEQKRFFWHLLGPSQPILSCDPPLSFPCYYPVSARTSSAPIHPSPGRPSLPSTPPRPPAPTRPTPFPMRMTQLRPTFPTADEPGRGPVVLGSNSPWGQ